jgi:hypothetical protein
MSLILDAQALWRFGQRKAIEGFGSIMSLQFPGRSGIGHATIDPNARTRDESRRLAQQKHNRRRNLGLGAMALQRL